MTASRGEATRPIQVYGSAISYFTGKFEAYLRYKEIAYQRIPMTPFVRGTVGRRTGTTQMPAALLPDGRWMTDTTPMIAWLESQHPEPAVILRDPLQAFASRLLEDYADEWLWRPALHYRWSYRGDALLLSRRIVDEMMPRVPIPGWLKRAGIRQRQLRRYVRGDGIGPRTRTHVESIYLRSLEQLDLIFACQPFLLGERPTLADFGFFASMFRHFGLDPTPGAIMQERAPHVFAWLGRVWEARGSRTQGTLASGIPGAWSPIFREVGEATCPTCARTPRRGRRTLGASTSRSRAPATTSSRSRATGSGVSSSCRGTSRRSPAARERARWSYSKPMVAGSRCGTSRRLRRATT